MRLTGNPRAIRMTDDELSQVKHAAEASRMSRHHFMRAAIMGRVRRVLAEQRKREQDAASSGSVGAAGQ
jgi:uncharacterized protein (DUF1778 family)